MVVPTGWSSTGKVTIKQLGRRYNWTLHSLLAQASGLPAPYFMYRLPAAKAQKGHHESAPADKQQAEQGKGPSCEPAAGGSGSGGGAARSVEGGNVSLANCNGSSTTAGVGHQHQHHHHHKPRRDGVLGLYVVAITPAAAATIASHQEYRKGRFVYCFQYACDLRPLFKTRQLQIMRVLQVEMCTRLQLYGPMSLAPWSYPFY